MAPGCLFNKIRQQHFRRRSGVGSSCLTFAFFPMPIVRAFESSWLDRSIQLGAKKSAAQKSVFASRICRRRLSKSWWWCSFPLVVVLLRAGVELYPDASCVPFTRPPPCSAVDGDAAVNPARRCSPLSVVPRRHTPLSSREQQFDLQCRRLVPSAEVASSLVAARL